MSITDKERHVLNVGHLMRKLATQLQYPTEMTNEMYILGCCHETPASEFEKYRYLPEIINCKNPNSDYESPALTLLNFAEIHIDERGYLTSAKERLEEVETRFGVNSKEYTEAQRFIDKFCTKELTEAFQHIDTHHFIEEELQYVSTR